MIETTVVLPPEIRYLFNPMMLDPLLGLYLKAEKILERSKKKIRAQDVGRRRQMDELYEKILVAYERKKAEEADYKAKVKEATKGRYMPNVGRTCIFRKV